jgi:uncharacterized membrane protein
MMNPQYINQVLPYLQGTEFPTPLISTIVAMVVVTMVVGAYVRTGSEDKTWSLTNLDEEETNIVNLLDSEDGEVKQKKFSTEFDWSDAKVSRLTTRLEDKNIVEKSMVERENIVRLNESNRIEE